MFKLLRNINKLTSFYRFSHKTQVKQCLANRIVITNHHHGFNNYRRNYCTANQDDEVFQLDEEKIRELAGDDEEEVRRINVIILEAELLRQEGKCVPPVSTMTAAHWKELLAYPSRSARKRYLEFRFKVAKKKENRVAKKEEKRREYVERPPLEIEGPMHYALSHNNILLRVYDTTMNHMYNSKLISAMMYSQKIVIDCGYADHMTKRECVNAAKQIVLLFSENRMHADPFDVHYCNFQHDSVIGQYLQRMIPTMNEPDFPFNVHECSYLDLFPKEQLVYLTPHCREELTEYDHDAIYIVGGIVDKENNEPVSLAKAKREGLKMAKLPLDKYLSWGAGSGKSLTLNQVVSIMLDQRRENNWPHSFRHVPRRKLVNDPPPMRNSEFGLRNNRFSMGNKMDTFKSSYVSNRSSWKPKLQTDQQKERMVHLKNILNE